MSCNLIQIFNQAAPAIPGKTLLKMHFESLFVSNVAGAYPSTPEEMGHTNRVLPADRLTIREDGRFGKCLAFGTFGTIEATLNTDEEIGTDDLTVEFWVRYLENRGATGLFSLGSVNATNVNTLSLRLAGNRLQLSLGDGSAFYFEGNTGLPNSTMPWSHFAVTKKAGVYKLWYNGKLLATAQNTTPILGRAFVFGQSGLANSVNFPEHVDELRVIKGHAVYDAPFTPPVGPF